MNIVADKLPNEFPWCNRISKTKFSTLPLYAILLTLIAIVSCDSEPETRSIATLVERPFPVELQDESDPMAPEQVVAAYIDYFGGSRLAPRDAVESGQSYAITDYCSDFTGQVIHNPPISGSTFFWNVKKSDDLPWNSVLVIIDFNDPTVPEKLGESRGSDVVRLWSPATLDGTAVFRSPDCS